MPPDPPAQRLIAYLTVDDPDAALDFYGRAFGAETTLKLTMGGRIGHAEMTIGGSPIMLSGEWPEMGVLGPRARGGPTGSFALYVEDADAAVARAVDAGATLERAVEDQFYGDRAGTVVDPFGHRWSLNTRQRDLSQAEMQRAMDAMAEGMAEGQPS